MNLNPGSHVGPYEIVSLIGEGGMGVVYRARDKRLDRDVALKVLPEVFASDPERMARFQREALLLASLSHPNIAPIHGVEESGSGQALVMELVEGSALVGPLPLDEALPIARQIAEALEYAHERGVVHRDLKPANVKVTKTGQVKLLDFGLAKALENETTSDAANSPTLSVAATLAGVILGTAAYMAPEQAKGKPADQRADIWAFGVVLCELLTGRRLFSGETASETLASVIKDPIAIPDTHPAIQRLLRRCLERDPRRRLRHIGEARIVIEDVINGVRSDEVAQVPAAAARPGKVWWAAASILIAGVGILSWFLKPVPEIPETPLLKFDIPVDKLQISDFTIPRISPDGRHLLYTSDGKLWVRDLRQIQPRELVSSGNPEVLFWSPDSTAVGYFSNGRLWKVPLSGGQPSVITVAPRLAPGGAGGVWQPDGRIVFTSGGITGLQQVSADGGDLQTLLLPDEKQELDYHQVSDLPGRGLLYVIHRPGGGAFDTIAVLANQTRKEIFRLDGERLRSPLYSRTGHILFERTTTNPGIWALPFSLEKLESTGEPFLVAPHGSRPSLSQNGTLAYFPDSSSNIQELVWVDRSGKVLGVLGRPQSRLISPALSPDGRRVSVSAGGDIWVYDVARGTDTQLTFGEGDEQNSVWAPSGDRIFFDTGGTTTTERSIASEAASGEGQIQSLTRGVSPAISPVGKFLVFTITGEKTGQDLFYVRLGEDPKPIGFLQLQRSQSLAEFSPDGRYLAYMSDERGSFDVYVKPFPSGEGKWRISTNGGFRPRWRGNKIYYEEAGKLMEVDVSTQPPFDHGTPRLVFSSETSGVNLSVRYDVSADGKRFIAVRPALTQTSRTPAITVVQNWFSEFRNRK
jgi:serine/threonine protein kinase